MICSLNSQLTIRTDHFTQKSTNMQALAVLLVISFIGLSVNQMTPEIKAKVLEIGRSCMEESGADLEMIIKLQQGEFSDDPKLKKQFLCMNKKIGVQKENGDIDEAVIKERINQITNDAKRTEELMKKCLIKKATPEESAFESYKCLYNEAPKDKILGFHAM
ncbi:B2 protein-like [Diabrotica undecimpunctata]|uniref:B2 protein-like n=1 Tax=Diabrotica undecimpunctata TaxID=50387 RepID=UPI003B641028